MRICRLALLLISIASSSAFADGPYVQNLRSLDENTNKSELFAILFKFEPYQRLPDQLAVNDIKETLDWLQQRALPGSNDVRFGYAYSAWLWKADIQDTASAIFLRTRIIARADGLRCKDQTSPSDQMGPYERLLAPYIEKFIKSQDSEQQALIFKAASVGIEDQIAKRPPDEWICNGGIAFFTKHFSKPSSPGDQVVKNTPGQLGTVIAVQDDAIKPDFLPDDQWQTKQKAMVTETVESLSKTLGWGPGPSDEIVRQYPYRLTISLIVDGQTKIIDRAAACEYHKMTSEARGDRTTQYAWHDETPGSVATILPNNQAVVVELPSLCKMEFNLAPSKDDDVPFIEIPKNYTPVVLWIQDVRDITSFELYPSIQVDSSMQLRARVTAIVAEHTNETTTGTPATQAEADLARRFGQLNSSYSYPQFKEFLAHAAYVIPKSVWGKNKILSDFFANNNNLTYVSDSKDPATRQLIRQYWLMISQSNQNELERGIFSNSRDGHDEWGNPPLKGSWDNQSAAYYEIPIVEKSGSWVLERESRGIRVYEAIQFRDNQDITLSYKNLAITKGFVFDPDTQELISQVILLNAFR